MTLYLREEFAEAWDNQDAFSAVDNLQGEMFREVKDRRTFRFELAGRSYFAKIHRGVGWLEIFKNLLSLRKPVLGAQNEWQAINALQELNIPTMSAAAYGERGVNPAQRFSFLVTDELKPVISLETVCAQWSRKRPSFAFKKNLLLEVARLSRLLHKNKICHRDFYLCHFLLRCEEDGRVDETVPPHLSIIDLHRALLKPALVSRWIQKDIAGLYFSALDIGLTRTDFFRFIKAYCKQPLRVALQQHAGLWSVVEQKAQKIWQRDLRKKERRLLQIVYKDSACVARQQSATQLAIVNKALWKPDFQVLIEQPDELMKKAVMLKNGDSTTVVAITLDGREWVIKRYNLKNPLYALSRMLRPSRAWHCWGSAFRLTDAGIATPAPLLMLEKRWGPLRRQAWFVTERVAGQDVLRTLEFESPESLKWQQALDLFDELFRRMRQHRLIHGDMKATNFILQEQENGQPTLQVLDLDATRIEQRKWRFQKYFARDLRRFYANWRYHDAAARVNALVSRFMKTL
jgi:heptose I phosphotransferase